MASQYEIELTSANFETEVLLSDKPVLVDFWAAWCAPCRAVAPAVAEVAEEMHGSAKVGKVNTDENQHLAMQFGIRSIPTLMIFNKGEVVEQLVGVQPKSVLKDKLQYYAGIPA
ncbi:MAG: thioredoxin [Deferribacteres bacterium]|nr:thioredoxin [candidate division KSB1 bacterium]MCB9503795.1 thioredoxin [Deferribacteres bacterium]